MPPNIVKHGISLRAKRDNEELTSGKNGHDVHNRKEANGSVFGPQNVPYDILASCDTSRHVQSPTLLHNRK
jgi:hypothetical protein